MRIVTVILHHKQEMGHHQTKIIPKTNYVMVWSDLVHRTVRLVHSVQVPSQQRTLLSAPSVAHRRR